MASPAETLPTTRKRTRKSIAHLPSSENKENMTADIGDLAAGGKNAFTTGGRPKKSRSKSIGPGGLDALTVTAGNRRKVGLSNVCYCEISAYISFCQVNSCWSPSKVYLEADYATSSTPRDSSTQFVP